jgi:AraC-like DNA-binding protein
MRLSPVNLMTLIFTLDVEGYDSAPLLKLCGHDSLDAMQADETWVDVELFDRMMTLAIELTGDPSFGLVAGKSLALTRYGPFTPLVLFSPSLRQLLNDLRQFARLVVERSEVELAEGPQGARLVVLPVVQRGPGGRFRTELVASCALQMLRFAGAGNDDVHRIDFPYPCPGEFLPRYQASFGPAIEFGQRECALHFNPALLDAPLITHDPVAYTVARTRIEAALAVRQARSNIAERVRQWLLASFPRQPSTAATAEHLRISERSLRRHLALQGVTHASLVDECQRMMAERLLADGTGSLKQVADTLGFSSVSSFHRAFRRWTGQTPSSWREQRGVESSAP